MIDNRNLYEGSTTGPNTAVAFGTGFAVGIIAALLLAPAPGRDTRRRLGEVVGGLKDRAHDLGDRAQHLAERAGSTLKHEAERVGSALKHETDRVGAGIRNEPNRMDHEAKPGFQPGRTP